MNMRMWNEDIAPSGHGGQTGCTERVAAVRRSQNQIPVFAVRQGKAFESSTNICCLKTIFSNSVSSVFPSCSGRPHARAARQGFTLIELLVVIAIIAILAAMLLPVLGKAKTKGEGVQCMNNTKQLTLAWLLYADEHTDWLLACQNGVNPNRPNWIQGQLDYSPVPANYDPAVNIMTSPMWPYTGKSPAIFKCPADKAMIVLGAQRRPRIRSNSMSQVFGYGEWLAGGPNRDQTMWRVYQKRSNIVNPANTFVFVDEHPDSINDAAFANQVSGTGQFPPDVAGGERIIDIPASYHNGACGFSFADGHSEIRKWVGSNIKVPPSYSGVLLPPSPGTLNYPAGNAAVDVQWMARNTTVRR